MDKVATRCLLLGGIVFLQLTVRPVAFAQDSDPRIPPSVESTIPLTADEIISTLRFDPDLLLKTKSLIIQKAADQGSFLDPEELTDEAVFRSIREDVRTRALVAQQIRDYGRVKSPPVYRDESEAQPDDSGMNQAGQPRPWRPEPGVPPDDSLSYGDRPDAYHGNAGSLPGGSKTPGEERKSTMRMSSVVAYTYIIVTTLTR